MSRLSAVVLRRVFSPPRPPARSPACLQICRWRSVRCRSSSAAPPLHYAFPPVPPASPHHAAPSSSASGRSTRWRVMSRSGFSKPDLASSAAFPHRRASPAASPSSMRLATAFGASRIFTRRRVVSGEWSPASGLRRVVSGEWSTRASPTPCSSSAAGISSGRCLLKHNKQWQIRIILVVLWVDEFNNSSQPLGLLHLPQDEDEHRQGENEPRQLNRRSKERLYLSQDEDELP